MAGETTAEDSRTGEEAGTGAAREETEAEGGGEGGEGAEREEEETETGRGETDKEGCQKRMKTETWLWRGRDGKKWVHCCFMVMKLSVFLNHSPSLTHTHTYTHTHTLPPKE